MTHRPFKNALKTFKVATKKRPPDPIIQADFKQLVGEITQLKSQDYYYPEPIKPSPIPKKRPPEQFYFDAHLHYIDLFDSSRELTWYLKENIPKEHLKKLQKNYWKSVMIWDIHGLNRDQVLTLLPIKIYQTQQLGRCLKIIHGQGFGSKNQEAILKKIIRLNLKNHPSVLAFCDEHQYNQGALMVLLEKIKSY